MFDTHLI